MKKFIEKVFGGLKISWVKLIIFAVVMGIFTALMAMLVPDGNSFHDIAVTAEWWVLPAILIIVNSKKPLEAALKTFVFFLISQPLVYLIQVPFNAMGLGLFSFYKYWFLITLLTFPGAFLGWFIKEKKWYAGVILAVMTAFLAVRGVELAKGMPDYFPNHLLTTIYCFVMIPVLIFGILKDKWAKVIAGVITIGVPAVMLFMGAFADVYETYNNSFLSEYDIVFVNEPEIVEGAGNVSIIKVDEGNYNFKLRGERDKKYRFVIADGEARYEFEYYFDKDLQTIVVKKI